MPSAQRIKTPRVYSVSELTQEIKLILENAYSCVWVEGEVSNFIHHLSGHMYFSLKDKDAVISACLFRNAKENLKFKLKDGLQVICSGRVSVYGKRGQYQIVIERVEPKGVGALQLAFEQLKEKLYKEGLFDPARKKPLPRIPLSVGIVTSPSGAAIRDILKILKTEAGFLRLILRPTMVQGESAKHDIAQAIAEFNQHAQVDILIVGRGGGSLEDLWAFNEEVVARAIFNSKIPVISAVGHEIDTTISDLVADQRSETPTAAANLIVSKKNEALEFIERSCLLLSGRIKEKIAELEERCGLVTAHSAFKHPLQKIEGLQQDTDDLCRLAALALEHFLRITGERFKTISGRFQALNPLAILSRGFSLTTTLEGGIVKDSNSLKKGQLVKTKLGKGSFQSEVIKIERN